MAFQLYPNAWEIVMRAWFEKLSTPQKAAVIAIAGIPVLTLIGALTPTPEKERRSENTVTHEAAAQGPSPKPKPKSKPVSRWAQFRADAKDKFDDRYQGATRSNGVVVVEIKAADNFNNKAIRTGIREDTGNLFEVAYKDRSDLRPKEVIAQFTFPLVNTATGKEHQGIVAVYSLRRTEASDIEWDKKDVIDWDNYKTMQHPAIE